MARKPDHKDQTTKISSAQARTGVVIRHPPLYCAWAEDDEARVFVRAENRNAAKLRVKEHFPNAKFFR